MCCPCGSRRISSLPKVRDDAKLKTDGRTLISKSSDPTLLPTTRVGSDPMDCELGYYHRLAPKTHIGLLCLVIIWLLPLGIILSGGTSYLTYSSIQTTSFEPFTWENMKRAEHCLRFKTRKYMAKSVGNSPGRGGVIECEASSAEIHGVTLHPDYCENLVCLLPRPLLSVRGRYILQGFVEWNMGKLGH